MNFWQTIQPGGLDSLGIVRFYVSGRKLEDLINEVISRSNLEVESQGKGVEVPACGRSDIFST